MTHRQPTICNGKVSNPAERRDMDKPLNLALVKTSQPIHTAEYVSPKHPDKLCDQISDAILDEYLHHDNLSRVAIETVGGHGQLTITGEVTSQYHLDNDDIHQIVDSVLGDNNLAIKTNIVQQSPEIARGVDTGGAGDQGIMIGYATDETPELLPLEFVLAHSLNRHIYDKHPYDGKTQITIQRRQIAGIVASFQNTKTDDIRSLIAEWLDFAKAKYHISASNDIVIAINPCGDWSNGGFDADTGLTGRKIVVDAYGPRVPVGGGAFSGKDPSKVDRSSAYYARHLAVKLLKKHNAHEVKVEVAYAIGQAKPLQATTTIDGIQYSIADCEQFRPSNIIQTLNLRRPIYRQLTVDGFFSKFL